MKAVGPTCPPKSGSSEVGFALEKLSAVVFETYWLAGEQRKLFGTFRRIMCASGAAFILTCGVAAGQATEPTWERTFNRPGTSSPSGLVETQDGGFLIAGSANAGLRLSPSSVARGNWDIWLLKVSALGEETWEQVVGGSASDQARSLLQTRNGGFLVVGITWSQEEFDAGMNIKAPAGSEARAVRLDRAGQIVWNRRYRSSQSFTEAIGAVETTDGGFLIAGTAKTLEPGSSDAWIVRIDQSGTPLWGKIFRTDVDDATAGVVNSPDRGFVLVGSRIEYGRKFTWIRKLDSSGETLRYQELERISSDWLQGDDIADVASTRDGGFVIAGTSYDDSRKKSVWIRRYDADARRIWQRMYDQGNQIRLKSMTLSKDGGLVVAGSAVERGRRFKTWIMKLSADGQETWRNDDSPGDGRTDREVAFIVETRSGAFIATGVAGSFIEHQTWLMLLDRRGRLLPRRRRAASSFVDRKFQ